MRDCPATQEAVWDLVDAGGTDRCTLCGGLPEHHRPERRVDMSHPRSMADIEADIKRGEIDSLCQEIIPEYPKAEPGTSSGDGGYVCDMCGEPGDGHKGSCPWRGRGRVTRMASGHQMDTKPVQITKTRVLQAVRKWARLGSNQRVRLNAHSRIGVVWSRVAGVFAQARLVADQVSSARLDSSGGHRRDMEACAECKQPVGGPHLGTCGGSLMHGGPGVVTVRCVPATASNDSRGTHTTSVPCVSIKKQGRRLFRGVSPVIERDSVLQSLRVKLRRGPSKRLTYAATARCKCGAGLAYRSGDTAWDCSEILLGSAIPSGQPGAVQHSDIYPFTFYEIKSERQPSANGATTRPS